MGVGTTEDNLMSIPVTVNLSDEVYQRAKRFALIANRDLSSVISDTVFFCLRLIEEAMNWC